MAAGVKTGGRQKGTPNKATASLKDLARKYTDDALLTLSDIMADEEQPAAARVSAASALLDRGYGKPSQFIGGDEENPLNVKISGALAWKPAQ